MVELVDEIKFCTCGNSSNFLVHCQNCQLVLSIFQPILVLQGVKDVYFLSNIREIPIHLAQLLIQKMEKLGVPLKLIIAKMSYTINGEIVIQTVMVRTHSLLKAFAVKSVIRNRQDFS